MRWALAILVMVTLLGCKTEPRLAQTYHSNDPVVVDYSSPDERVFADSIRGQVDSPDGKPLAGILVEVIREPSPFTKENLLQRTRSNDRVVIQTMLTDKEGQFHLKHLANGYFQIRLSKPEFQTLTLMGFHVQKNDPNAQKVLEVWMDLEW